jgi:hypothetical protein
MAAAVKLRNDPINPPAVAVPGSDGPIRKIKSEDLKMLGQKLDRLFTQYVSDRRIQELKWLRNLRQYLGYYDPDIEKEMSATRSKSYPKVTRIKCVSTLSRIMYLMFPSDEKNWALKASPSPDMSPQDVQQAIADQQKKDKEDGAELEVDDDYITAAVQTLANSRAEKLATLIDDQMEELGGNQTLDYIALNRAVIKSGIMYGLGVLLGPYAREIKTTTWTKNPQTGAYMPKLKTKYMPMFEFCTVWDFYPDLSAKNFMSMDGYFTRKVMSRAQVKALGKRMDFFEDVIDKYLTDFPVGNYRPQPFETDLRGMGVKVNVNETKTETSKYEVLIWQGPVDGHLLSLAGVDVPADKLSDSMDAEVWMIAGNVIKADLNPWVELGVDVRTYHPFIFDEDDTAPIGNGLPNIVRDSQMSVCAGSRMLLDNASVVCGPNLELNTDLLRADQDLSSISAYKNWYREGTGADAQYPAVRNVSVDAHLDDLMKIIDLYLKFADSETFVNPATGGDMEKMPSEPMRTAAGASMMRGDAALPFKDIIRNFDQFTMSMVYAMVQFNRKFNPSLAPEGDYNVIARGATSLIAKEVRGMQADSFSQTTKPEEMIHVDERKLVKMRLAARDMNDVLVSEAEAKRRQDGKNKTMQEQAELAKKQAEADERKTLADAYKNISQGTKNLSASQAQIVNAALEILQNGLEHKVGADVMDQADQQMQQTMQPQPQMPPDGQGGGMPPEDQGGGMPEGMPPQ